jgi:ComF family protein
MPLARVAGFLGSRCQVCGRPSPDAGLACGECAAILSPRTGGYCPSCGLLYHDEQADPHICGACRTKFPPWDALYFYGPYDGLLGDLIREYKFNARLGLSKLLSSLLMAVAEGRGLVPDIAVPVPLHRRRLRERGFNQSLELARPLARALGAELRPSAMTRARFTAPQVSLKAAQRRDNVKGAFTVDQEQVAGRRILLVDDIMTTGGTMTECTRVLKKAGAKRVEVLVLARTG